MKNVLFACFISLTWSLNVYAADTIVIKGDKTLGQSLVKELAEGYMTAGHLAKFQFELRDSSLAFKSLTGSRAQIGLSARPIRASELEALRVLDVNIEEHVAALDFMVVIANARNSVKTLTLKQVESLFAGTTSDWNRVGGDRLPVKVFTPLRDTATYALFQKSALNRRNFAGGSRELKTDQEIARNVGSQPGAIGFVGLSSSRGRRVKALTIDGVEPRPSSGASYPLSRKLYYYTIRQRTKPASLDFIKWATTDAAAKKIIATAGYVAAAANEQPPEAQ